MSYHVTYLTPEAAEAYDRRTYGPPGIGVAPDVQLGWKPYTIRVTRDAISTFACHTEPELTRWANRYGLTVGPRTTERDGIACGRLTEKMAELATR